MNACLSREKILDLEQSARTNVACYELGALRGYMHVRVPVRLAAWLLRRAARKRERKELREELEILRRQGEIE